MEQTNRAEQMALRHLCAILDAGEKGYGVAAANVDNRALKMLFKAYAKQRADFKAGLDKRIERPRPRTNTFTGILAMLHRGRINIFAALTIGDENRGKVVMKEVLLGEQAALRAYQRALRAPLAGGTKELVRKQYEAVQQVVEQVELMYGKDGKELVVRLYDTENDAGTALRIMQQAHLTPLSVEELPARDGIEKYDGSKQSALLETIFSGAAGGALWGAVSGALAGFGVLHLPTLGLEKAPLTMQELVWASTALAAIVAGGFVGAVLGTFIGWGIHGGDAYLDNESQRRGETLLKVQIDHDHADQAVQIMAQVNREARSHGAL